MSDSSSVPATTRTGGRTALRLAPVRDFSGPVPPRTHPSGFAGIAKVITGQQVSVQADTSAKP